MRATDLPQINPYKDNVKLFPWPRLDERPVSDPKKDVVVFFGSDFLNMRSEIDLSAYVAEANACLEYLRRHHPSDQWWYKPHPNEREEHAMLNLTGFKIVMENIVSEIFILKHSSVLRATYATVSSSPIFAWRIGIDSHVFLPVIEHVFDATSRPHLNAYFAGMPEAFFIRDLTSRPEISVSAETKNPWLEEMRMLMPGDNGFVWMIVCETKFVPALLSLAQLIRKMFPQKRLVVAIVRHGSRWSPEVVDLLREAFDEVREFPRLFYTLKPWRLWQSARIAHSIKKIGLDKHDLLFGFAPHDFIENCFVSYHRDIRKVVCMEESIFNIHFKPQDMEFLRNKEFRFDKASWFYNKIFEPLLGLHRSLFLRYSFGLDHYISRPQEPINDIYDEIYLLKPSA